MKIALIDLNHMTLGVHTNTVPLGLGLIANYLKRNVPAELDIRIFKDPQKCLDVLDGWQPDILGMAQYAWNSELNLFVAKRVKSMNPACLVVAGGPNLELEVEEKRNYLQAHPWIDLCVSFDGEIPFAEIVKSVLSGKSVADLRKGPVAGTYALDPESGKLVESPEPPPRLASLDVFGAMYAEGFFDGMIEEGFHPFLQTHRGCPFRCAYCHTGDSYYTKMLFQSVENFKRDMEYLGKRFAGDHNIVLYLANTNFGLFEQDFEIAQVIRDTQEKYDWPKEINVNSGKDPDKLLRLVSMLKYKFMPAIALQTLTPKVLQNIGRVNIPFDRFLAFQNEVARTLDANTATELILSLPEETKESFLATLKQVLNSGVQNIVIYTLMSLKGTVLASRSAAQKYAHMLRYRIVPRCFSEIDHEKIFDVEEVVVGTRSMPYADYLDLRGVALMITVFASSIELMPLRRALLNYEVDLADWVHRIQRAVLGHARLREVYRQFITESEKELFETPEALKSFFERFENYKALCEGKFGDNLLRKYKTLFLSLHFPECLDMAYGEAAKLIREAGTLFPEGLLEDLRIFLKSRDIGNVFTGGYAIHGQDRITLRYDIPRWLDFSEQGAALETKGPYSYRLEVTDYMQQRLKNFLTTNRDPVLSAQMLYRDGSIKDFWPRWTQVRS